MPKPHPPQLPLEVVLQAELNDARTRLERRLSKAGVRQRKAPDGRRLRIEAPGAGGCVTGRILKCQAQRACVVAGEGC